MCLLHDASEAYIADVTRPVKKELKEYLGIESRLQNAIYEKFLGTLPTEEERALISAVDDAMLFHEFYHYMGEKIVAGEPELMTEPDFYERPFKEVEAEFIAAYNNKKQW